MEDLMKKVIKAVETSTELLILRGLPCSGKSTYAKSLKKKYKRINRDDIRAMLGYSYTEGDNQIEAIITGIEHKAIASLLRCGYNVVSDNMNLRKKYVQDLHDIAKEVGNVYVRELTFSVSLPELKMRDYDRWRQSDEMIERIGDDVLDNLYSRFKDLFVPLEDGVDSVVGNETITYY